MSRPHLLLEWLLIYILVLFILLFIYTMFSILQLRTEFNLFIVGVGTRLHFSQFFNYWGQFLLPVSEIT